MTTLHRVSDDYDDRRMGPIRAYCGLLVSYRELAKAVEAVNCEKCLKRMDEKEKAEV